MFAVASEKVLEVWNIILIVLGITFAVIGNILFTIMGVMFIMTGSEIFGNHIHASDATLHAL